MEYLNLAINNITRIQKLARCESLKKLDLTVNFISKAALPTVGSLRHNPHLEELYLLGNPCSEWEGYRKYVIGKVPQLRKLDGAEIKHSERILAHQQLAVLEEQLGSELAAEGLVADCEDALGVDEDWMDEDAEILETGYRDETGELKRPWCPATRILEHREMQQQNEQAQDKKKEGQQGGELWGQVENAQLRTSFPEIKDGEPIHQKNEGKWAFSLEESPDGHSLILEVDVGKFLDTSLIQADVQPKYLRLLIKGKLLQLLLPVEIKPDRGVAQRSNATGKLVLTLPKEDPDEPVVDVQYLRPKNSSDGTEDIGLTKGKVAPGRRDQQRGSEPLRSTKVQEPSGSILRIVRPPGASNDEVFIREVRVAQVLPVTGGVEDDDTPPPLH